ncbi:hypothetical protein QBC37DRAFT_383848 [Rhypophila decipiens]|uniref:Uncharacterized protein n=1 Tax=Rhypophila decipiens TaxID=261697 RepID=A0AAN7BEG4_9PEZI|nr:hypothetical protein QBC37DRAFT_383848 [Rhypophila decipiens]
MANKNPATPVKVPPSATNYTSATQDSDLRSQINGILLTDGHIGKIQDYLLHSLHAHSSNWPTAIQNHAISLLRSGEVTSFPALLRRVMEDVRHETITALKANNTNGAAEVNGNNKKSANGDSNGTSAGTPSLAVPQSVVEDAIKVTRECLETVCEIEDTGAT